MLTKDISSVAVIRITPSGSIITGLLNGVVPVLQFNCSCNDALPICQAQCCKLRNTHNVSVSNPDELVQIQTVEHPNKPGVRIMAWKEDLSCVYQREDLKCSIHHTTKPTECKQWHCSPGGVGDGIRLRGDGWLMLPVTK